LAYAHDEEGMKYLSTKYEGDDLTRFIKSTEKFMPTDMMKIHYLKTKNGGNTVVFELMPKG